MASVSLTSCIVPFSKDLTYWGQKSTLDKGHGTEITGDTQMLAVAENQLGQVCLNDPVDRLHLMARTGEKKPTWLLPDWKLAFKVNLEVTSLCLQRVSYHASTPQVTPIALQDRAHLKLQWSTVKVRTDFWRNCLSSSELPFTHGSPGKCSINLFNLSFWYQGWQYYTWT